MQIKLTQSCVTQGCVTQICAIFGNPICQCSFCNFFSVSYSNTIFPTFIVSGATIFFIIIFQFYFSRETLETLETLCINPLIFSHL